MSSRASWTATQGPGITHTPITMIHATLAPGAELTLPWREDFNGLAYVLAGRGTVGAERRPVQLGQTAVFGDGGSLTVRADEKQDSPHAGPGGRPPGRAADP